MCIQTYFFNFIYSGLCHKVCLTAVTSFRAKVISSYVVYMLYSLVVALQLSTAFSCFFNSVTEKASSSSSLSLFGVAVCLIYIMSLINFFCQTPEWIECITAAYKYCVDRNWAPCIVGKNKQKYRLITAAAQRDWLYWFLQWVLTREV